MDYIIKLADENGLMKQKNKASFSEYFKVFLSTCKITQTRVITQMSVISQNGCSFWQIVDLGWSQTQCINLYHLISLITFDFCHSPMTNQRSPIIHFQWTYDSPYFNHYPAPISCHSTPIIDYPLPIEYHKQPSTVAHQF